MTEGRRLRRILLRSFAAVAGLLAIMILYAGVRIASEALLFPWSQDRVDTVQATVTSVDGTTIAFERSGTGPPVVLVGAALADRDGTAKLEGSWPGSSLSSTTTAAAAAKVPTGSPMRSSVKLKTSKR